MRCPGARNRRGLLVHGPSLPLAAPPSPLSSTAPWLWPHHRGSERAETRGCATGAARVGQAGASVQPAQHHAELEGPCLQPPSAPPAQNCVIQLHNYSPYCKQFHSSSLPKVLSDFLPNLHTSYKKEIIILLASRYAELHSQMFTCYTPTA